MGRRHGSSLLPVTTCLVCFSILQFSVIAWLFHGMAAGRGPEEMFRGSKSKLLNLARGGLQGFQVSMSGKVDGSLSLKVEDDHSETRNDEDDPDTTQAGNEFNWDEVHDGLDRHEGSQDEPGSDELHDGGDRPEGSPERSLKATVCDGQEPDVDGIQIHILAWKRPQSLYVLMEQLRQADYSGWHKDVPIFVHVDGGADPLVLQVAEGVFGFTWPYGQVHADIREENHGLREMWLSSLRTAATIAGSNTLMIVLEDDMRVSSIYFQWLLLMINTYARSRWCRHKSLMGFSLSSVRLMEMRKPFKRWRVKESFPPSTREFAAYISTLPSSWGGAYWSDRWLEFDEFVSVRMRPAYYDIAAESQAKTVKSFTELVLTPPALYVPDARSNWWPGSWKRFMVDFMYGCGLFMLYPNLEGENALASTLSLQGKHSLKKDANGRRVDDELAADSQIAGPRKQDWKRKPQIAPLIRGDPELLRNLLLPDITVLQMTTLWMEPSTIQQAVTTGDRFVQAVIANDKFTDLGHAWCASARLRAPSRDASPMAV